MTNNNDIVQSVAEAIFLAEKGRKADERYWDDDCTGSFVYKKQAQAAIAAVFASPEMRQVRDVLRLHHMRYGSHPFYDQKQDKLTGESIAWLAKLMETKP